MPVSTELTLIETGELKIPLPGTNPMVTVAGEKASGWYTTGVKNWKKASVL